MRVGQCLQRFDGRLVLLFLELLDRLGDGFYDIYAEDEDMTSVVSYPNRCQLWGRSGFTRRL